MVQNQLNYGVTRLERRPRNAIGPEQIQNLLLTELGFPSSVNYKGRFEVAFNDQVAGVLDMADQIQRADGAASGCAECEVCAKGREFHADVIVDCIPTWMAVQPARSLSFISRLEQTDGID